MTQLLLESVKDRGTIDHRVGTQVWLAEAKSGKPRLDLLGLNSGSAPNGGLINRSTYPSYAFVPYGLS